MDVESEDLEEGLTHQAVGRGGIYAFAHEPFEIGDCARRLCEEYLRKAEAAQ